MDLRRLEIYCRVYDERSFSRAARQLALSQPSVSGHIKALEEHFGTRLFDRLGREILPTAAGRLLYRYGSRIVETKTAAAQAMEAFLQRLEGDLTLGASTIPGEYLLLDHLGPFRQAFPGIDVHLEIRDTGEIVDLVAAGEVEIGFVGARLSRPRLEYRAFASDELILVAPPTPEWNIATLSLEELAQKPLLVREQGSGTRLMLERRLRELGAALKDFQVVAQLAVLFILATISTTGAEGSGEHKIAALEQRVAELEAQNKAIVEMLEELRGQLPVSAPELPASTAPEPAMSTEPPLPDQVRLSNSNLGFHGFVRVDAIYEDSRSSAIQTPTFIPSEDPSLGTGDSDGSFNFHPRLTRFGMRYDGPKIGRRQVKLDGKIEIDFQNGGRESREIIRMRHAYMNLDWGRTSLLVGQTWDLISPLYPTVNNDTMMWNAGNLQARVGYAGKRWSLGLSGHLGREETRSPIAGEDRFDSSSLSLDFKTTRGRLTVQGEAWAGENLSDFRGGIGQGINTATAREIESAGGWLELGLELSEAYSLHVGYSIDDPTDDDLPLGGRIKNDAWYLVNRFRVGRPFMVGFDYLFWTTKFKGLEDGTDNRFNLYLVYNF